MHWLKRVCVSSQGHTRAVRDVDFPPDFVRSGLLLSCSSDKTVCVRVYVRVCMLYVCMYVGVCVCLYVRGCTWDVVRSGLLLSCSSDKTVCAHVHLHVHILSMNLLKVLHTTCACVCTRASIIYD